jgi:hypothetical protein
VTYDLMCPNHLRMEAVLKAYNVVGYICGFWRNPVGGGVGSQRTAGLAVWAAG